MKKTLIWITIIVSLLTFTGCDFFDALFGGGGNEIPKTPFNVPNSLTGSQTRTTGAPSDAAGTFEPFRNGLEFIQASVDIVNSIIDGLNGAPILDNMEFYDDGSDQLIVVTYDESRTYAKIITIYKGNTAIEANKFLKISYNKGIQAGEVIFNPKLGNPTGNVNMVKIIYDGTLAQPELKGYLTFDTAGKVATEIYPYSAYFTAAKSENIVSFEGAISYHYIFGDTLPLNSERAYMFKSKADIQADKAIVNLYFPKENDVTSVSQITDAYSISSVMENILYAWVTQTGNESLVTDIQTATGTPINDSASLITALNHSSLDNNNNVLALRFLTDLNNPIAYNGTTGYVAHGSAVSAEYTALGDLSGISFTLTPQQAINLAVTF